MNKKLLLSILAGLGIVSLFMPWASAYGFSLSLMSRNSSVAIEFLVLFVVIIVLSLLGGLEKPLDKNKSWAILIAAGLSLLNNLINISAMRTIKEFGVSIGIGYYFCFLISIALVVLAYLVKRDLDKGNQSLNIDFDKDKVMEATKKSWDVAKSFTNAVGKATKSAVAEIKKEMKKEEEAPEVADIKPEKNDGEFVEEAGKLNEEPAEKAENFEDRLGQEEVNSPEVEAEVEELEAEEENPDKRL